MLDNELHDIGRYVRKDEHVHRAHTCGNILQEDDLSEYSESRMKSIVKENYQERTKSRVRTTEYSV